MSKGKKIITSYLLHQYPDAVRAEFAEWFASSCDQEEKDALLAEHWQSLEPKTNKLQTRCSFKSVQDKINRQQSKARRMAVARYLMQVAAVIIVAVAVVFAIQQFTSANHRVEWQEVYVGFGDSKTVELSDGSTLCLAPGSRLIYPSSFDENVRKVYLSGEAYADIAKDEFRRFVVSTDQMDVVVHGTRFNVRSYDANSEVELMLLEGSVEMQTKSLKQNRTVAMSPGDLIKLDKRSGRIICETVNHDMFGQSSDAQRLTFINSRLGDISMQLERLFDVRIIIDQAELAEERYYSAFVNNESLDRILSTLKQNGKMGYYWRNGVIHLFYNN
ncbi:MAG: FecR family protein [Alistipes sp.]|nr:FecR family protein [Alistipes sp.]